MLSLLSPWFLAGLGALAVPILVHLIQKEQKTAIPFPSLMFVEQLTYRSSRRQRIRHWLLFLLRCLAIVLLVVAFARPFFASRHAESATPPATGGTDYVIALDRSYSMGYGDRWHRAVTAARNVIDQLGVSDRAAIVYFSSSANVAQALTHDRTALRAAIDTVHPSDAGTSYDAMVRVVRHVLGDTAQPRRELVLISDYQRAGWTDHGLPSLPGGTEFDAVDLADSTIANLAVAHVELRYDTSASRERVQANVRVVNEGDTPAAGRHVTLELNGRTMQTRTVDVSPHATAAVNFDPVLVPPGVSRGIVRVTPSTSFGRNAPDVNAPGADLLAADDHLYFTVERDPSVSVLVIEPSTGPGRDKPGAFLDLALGITQRLSFRVRSIRADRLDASALRGVALVILNGAPFPLGDAGQQLVRYVEGGGGLLVALGARSQVSTWPASANQLVPRPSGPAVGRGTDHPATLAYLDRGHAALELFGAPHSGDFSVARFLRYWPLSVGPGDVQLARFDDGHAALLERRVGAGRVLVWSSDLDGAWNDLPLQPVFLPLVQQLARYTAGYQDTRHWQTVGDVLNPSLLFGETMGSGTGNASSHAQYVVITPSERQARFGAGVTGGESAMLFDQQGFYDVKKTDGAGDSSRTVAVNVDLAESDLTPLDTALFRAAIAPRAGMDERSASSPAAGPQRSRDLERRQQLWWYIIIAALLVLSIETWLSNRLSGAARAGTIRRHSPR